VEKGLYFLWGFGEFRGIDCDGSILICSFFGGRRRFGVALLVFVMSSPTGRRDLWLHMYIKTLPFQILARGDGAPTPVSRGAASYFVGTFHPLVLSRKRKFGCGDGLQPGRRDAVPMDNRRLGARARTVAVKRWAGRRGKNRFRGIVSDAHLRHEKRRE